MSKTKQEYMYVQLNTLICNFIAGVARSELKDGFHFKNRVLIFSNVESNTKDGTQ